MGSGLISDCVLFNVNVCVSLPPPSPKVTCLFVGCAGFVVRGWVEASCSFAVYGTQELQLN